MGFQLCGSKSRENKMRRDRQPLVLQKSVTQRSRRRDGEDWGIGVVDESFGREGTGCFGSRQELAVSRKCERWGQPIRGRRKGAYRVPLPRRCRRAFPLRRGSGQGEVGESLGENTSPVLQNTLPALNVPTKMMNHGVQRFNDYGQLAVTYIKHRSAVYKFA